MARTGKPVAGCPVTVRGGGEWGEWGMTAKGHRDSCRGERNGLNLDVVIVAQPCDRIKTSELFTLEMRELHGL